MYDSVNQAYMRLRNTWVRYGDALVKVIEVGGKDDKPHLTVMDVYGDILDERVMLDDPKLVLEYPELGYFNDIGNNRCSYWYKRPARIQRQGLVMRDLLVKDGYEPDNRRYAAQECVFNRYPAIEECFNRLDGVCGSLAFNREYCIHTEEIGPTFLEHRGQRVGWWTSNSLDSLVLDTDYVYLLENLQHKYGVIANEYVG